MTVSIKDIDQGWGRINREIRRLNNSYVKVGVLSDAGGYEVGGANLASVATWNEFGTSKIPARPFMKQAFDNNKSQIDSMKDSSFGEVLKGTSSVEKALNKIGVFFKAKVQESIVKGGFSPNALFTISRKGSSKPLIDTGRLRQSINYETVIK